MANRILLLLVEDEPLIRMTLQDELEDKGFELVVATAGRQALSALDAYAGRLRGVLTDIRLGPGPDGWEVARRARELVPAIPVVYMSGDSGHEWTVKGVPKSVMVSKPFALAQITAAVSMLLNGANT
ncbi:response regulator [Rubellimicrobium arenae]|uniref:response regulator n=1 Tax=Rubellimicrobium arenae TaxID=2817372 RepID=UPI001FF01A98|nr:response regulator [Rubellimicrobium arenae]